MTQSRATNNSKTRKRKVQDNFIENSFSSSFVKYFDVGLKIVTIIALASVAFLGTKFVSKEEFIESHAALRERVSKIEEILIRMEASEEFNKRQDETLSDHEARIRVLEKTNFK